MGSSLGFDAVMFEAIRQQFLRLDLFNAHIINGHPEVQLKPTENGSARHIDEALKIYRTICDVIARKVKEPKFPIVFSGDHGNAAGTISGIKTAFPDKRLGVIWMDAHADLHSPYTSLSGNIHGMPLAISAAEDNRENQMNIPDKNVIEAWNSMKQIGTGQKKIDLHDIVFIGLRGFEKPEFELIEKHGVHYFTTNELNREGVLSITEQSLEHLRDCDLIYVSFDVDSLDPSISKGTGTPVDGGLSVAQAKKIISLLVKNEKVCCLEITEINPLLDTENKMAKAVLEIVEGLIRL